MLWDIYIYETDITPYSGNLVRYLCANLYVYFNTKIASFAIIWRTFRDELKLDLSSEEKLMYIDYQAVSV